MMQDFKIYSLLLVKNEEDIIKESLRDACRWSDKVIVIDNGSEDNTWEIVKSLAENESKIVPYLQYKGAFRIGLRAKAFYAFRHELSKNDWWCVRLDADEFFPTDVRAFLANVPKCFRTVKKESTDFVITKEDLQEYPFTNDFANNKQYIKYCLPWRRQERRFMRNSSLLIWKETWKYPHLLGRTYEIPIPVNHYQYRNPEQMQKRFATRKKAKADGCGTFRHENGLSWENYLSSRINMAYVESHPTIEAIISNSTKYAEQNYEVMDFVSSVWCPISCIRNAKKAKNAFVSTLNQSSNLIPIGFRKYQKIDNKIHSYFIYQHKTQN